MNLDFLPLILQTKSSFKNEKRASQLFLLSILIFYFFLLESGFVIYFNRYCHVRGLVSF